MRFVSEPVDVASFSDDAVGRGEPGAPQSFAWRDETYAVAKLLRVWKGTKNDRGDAYVRRHYFEVVLADGRTAVLYFERQAKRDAPRWWLYTIAEPRG